MWWRKGAGASPEAASELATGELDVSAATASSGVDSESASAELEASATTALSAAASELATAKLENSAAAAAPPGAAAELEDSATATAGRFGTFCTCIGTGIHPYLDGLWRAWHGLCAHK